MRIRPNLTTALLALGLAAYPFAAVADSTAIEPAGCDLTDATPCLQAAIDRAAASGVSVFIPAGTYALRTNLTLRTGVAIAGDAGALILPGPNNWSDPVLVSGDGISRVTISGLAFEGGGAAFANASALINLTNTTDVLFDHISIRHVRGKAITTVGSGPGSSARNGITNSILDDIGNHWKKSHQRGDRDMAVTFWGRTDGAGTGNFARANRFTDVGLDALQITGQDGFVAEGNVFELWNNQIKLLPSGDYPAAIFTTRATHVTIASNTIHQAVGNGIDAPGLTNSVIENNTIRECGQSGIGLFRNYDGTSATQGASPSEATPLRTTPFGRPAPGAPASRSAAGAPRAFASPPTQSPTPAQRASRPRTMASTSSTPTVLALDRRTLSSMLTTSSRATNEARPTGSDG